MDRVWKFLIDLALWCLAAPAAYSLRLLDEERWMQLIPDMLVFSAVMLPIKAAGLLAFRTYRQVWRTVGLRDIEQLIKVVAVVTLFELAVAFFLLPGFYHLPSIHLPGIFLPRSVPLIDALLAIVAMSSVRVVARLLYERHHQQLLSEPTRHVLVVGAGAAGTVVVRDMQRRAHSPLNPVGFLDDDPIKQRQTFVGIPVFGAIDDLPRIVPRERIDEILFAIPSAPGQVVARVMKLAQQAGVRLRTLPAAYELFAGNVLLDQVRDVDIGDLLCREPVQLDTTAIAGYLSGRVILVTGAGGSIGAEIVRQVARFAPARLVLVGRGENSLFHIDAQLARECSHIARTAVVCDVRHVEKLERIFATHRPDVVFHAAAHKHVPLMEQNPDEAVLNNMLGTQHVAQMCLAFEVERLVNISTDKAVNPTSVMGATKRAAEYIVCAATQRAKPEQVFVSVRFGNVLGSRGSVVPMFVEQIRRGGPVTVTHPEMTRYFMTIPEAAQLVLAAGSFEHTGKVYVLDMGEPVKIVELARQLIQLAGKTPDTDIPIIYTGIRPGEKLFEEIFTAEEGTTASIHKKIFVARGSHPPPSFSAGLAEVLAAARAGNASEIRMLLKRLVPTYRTLRPITTPIPPTYVPTPPSSTPPPLAPQPESAPDYTLGR